jgi:two-component system response regulator FixJ
MHNTSRAIICLVDDDQAVRASFRLFLEVCGFTVRGYASGNAFLAALEPEIGCVVLDYHLPGLNGIETLRQVRSQGWLMPAIIMTGGIEARLEEQALRSGAWAFLRKPIDPDVLLITIERAIQAQGKPL